MPLIQLEMASPGLFLSNSCFKRSITTGLLSMPAFAFVWSKAVPTTLFHSPKAAHPKGIELGLGKLFTTFRHMLRLEGYSHVDASD